MLHGRWDGPMQLNAPGNQGASMQRYVGGAVICAHFGRIAPCMVGELGTVQVTPQQTSQAVVEGFLGPRLSAAVPLGGHFSLPITLDVLGSLGEARAHLQAAPVTPPGAVLSFGVGVRYSSYP
jgi:hypothetical protein